MGFALAIVGLVVSGCGTRMSKAPVEDRGTSVSASASAGLASGAGVVVAKALPGAENAGKPGYYAVKPGDTLIRIGIDSGQWWKDIARWNAIENPNLIEVGQILRVVPPVVVGQAAVVSTGVVTRPITSSAVSPAVTPSGSKPSSAVGSSAIVATAPATPVSTPSGEDEVVFIWPAGGSLISGFDESRNKGYDISGKAGDSVLAAADGRVVYAGADLRGYGNLVVLKHNNTFLTAYAHNQSLLVKEDQAVRKGQKIAEMGSTDTDRVKLHFEIRRQGKPVDPSRYLPAR